MACNSPPACVHTRHGHTTASPRLNAIALAAWLALACGLASCGGGGGAAGLPTAPANQAPVANAVAPQSVPVSATVRLDGSASSDADNDPLAYAWVLLSSPIGSRTGLTSPANVTAAFVPDLPGLYRIGLTVNDGHASSPLASVDITALTPGVPLGYALVWSDEFAVDGLPDPTHWDYDTERNRLGWYNNERQYYARDRSRNAWVQGGQLLITARKEDLSGASDWGGQHYTSARLVSRGKAAWTYGFFEVRARMPCGRGTWPAIWTLGLGGVWPDDGELDILEQVGSKPARVFGTVHTLQSGGSGTGGQIQVPDACTAFHDYQMLWTANEIAIGMDGVTYYRYANPHAGHAAWPFDAPQYLLLNLAIGGTLGGSIDDSIFPVTMAVEHVRVWQARP